MTFAFPQKNIMHDFVLLRALTTCTFISVLLLCYNILLPVI